MLIKTKKILEKNIIVINGIQNGQCQSIMIIQQMKIKNTVLDTFIISVKMVKNMNIQGKYFFLDRETFRNKKEYKKLIYVSETDNSKLMKYENYSTKYELINSFVSPIVLGAIIIFLLRIFYKKIYKID